MGNRILCVIDCLKNNITESGISLANFVDECRLQEAFIYFERNGRVAENRKSFAFPTDQVR